ncbi:serotriflin-like [Numida meleagris]|uniref:serotriflin-like n=1 Tax=Numida meleagris TaxID=8996 RepID=UPI000B3DADCD|nr:serotriflin-like [Numida meleagris]
MDGISSKAVQADSDEIAQRSLRTVKRDFRGFGRIVQGVGAQVVFCSIASRAVKDTEWARKTQVYNGNPFDLPFFLPFGYTQVKHHFQYPQKYNGFQIKNKKLLHQDLVNLKNKQLILQEHNEIRRSVVPTARNMLKMVWNEKAAKNALKWANTCEMQVSPVQHRVIDGITCGENILLSSQPKTWAEAIKVWHNQASDFKYGFGSTTKGANVKSYAQLVWYNSYQVGCAVAHCPKNQYNYFYVCHYCPPGNNIMQVAAPYKKGPKCADCPGHCERGLCTNPCRHQDAYPNCKNMRSLFGCNHPLVKTKCPATCKCTTQIV